ncbi:MAG: O-antigen ligase family protein [Saprospiraceae bacterium]|nr:O-antigen ligase family protein [Saprospiraceae bacterium]MBX7239685.1 hypothetical protein [Bacteroidia bacterium]MCO5249736.1 hypothetical protein [Chitinophagales bacterium]MCO5279281.1 hypothetical protein [Saprospiraceae bacterium]HNA75186.1 hypothetical protein [Saprospiraceae bacterium]
MTNNSREKHRNIKKSWIIIIVILSIFLVPTLSFSEIPIRIEDFFFIFIIIGASKGSINNILRKILIAKRLVQLLVLFFIAALISFYISVFQDYIPTIQDYNYLISLLRNIIILIAGLLVGRGLMVPPSKLLFLISLGIMGSSLLSLVQFFDIFNIAKSVSSFYGKLYHSEFGVTRATGTLGNPNYASFFQMIGFIVLLVTNQPKVKVLRFIKYVSLVLVATSVIVTFSRTGFFSLALIIFLYIVLNKKGKLLLFSFFIIGFSIFKYSEIKVNARMADIFNERLQVDATLNGRVSLIWVERIDQFYKNLLFGNGTQRGSISTTIFSSTTFDNSFLFLLLTSGLIGLIIYLIFFYLEIAYFIKLWNSRYKIIYLFMIMLNALILIFFLTTDLLVNVSFTSYFYFIIGLLITYTNKVTRNIT